MNIKTIKYGIAVLAVSMISASPAAADIFDVIAGRQPILPVANPPAADQADRVVLRKPVATGHEVINPLTPLFPRQVVVGYKLETHYVTKWVKIPTTLYRPAIDLHARPGESILFKPVETFTWQLRQVPVKSYRPVLEDSSKNLFSRTYVPRLRDILEPIFPHYDASATAEDPYYEGGSEKGSADDEKIAPVEPGDERPKIESDAIKQPESADRELQSLQKVEIPENAEGESVLKKPIVTPPEETADGEKKGDENSDRDPHLPIPDPDANPAAPKDKEAPQENTTAPELVNPLDRTVRAELPRLEPFFFVPTSYESRRTANILILDDEGWIPVK